MVAFILAWTLLSLSSFGEGGSVLDRFLGKLLLSLAITVGLFALINLAYPLKRFDSEELTQWVKDHLVEEQEVSDESRTTTNPG